jgi:hypothetical protein
MPSPPPCSSRWIERDTVAIDRCWVSGRQATTTCWSDVAGRVGWWISKLTWNVEIHTDRGRGTARTCFVYVAAWQRRPRPRPRESSFPKLGYEKSNRKFEIVSMTGFGSILLCVNFRRSYIFRRIKAKRHINPQQPPTAHITANPTTLLPLLTPPSSPCPPPTPRAPRVPAGTRAAVPRAPHVAAVGAPPPPAGAGALSPRAPSFLAPPAMVAGPSSAAAGRRSRRQQSCAPPPPCRALSCALAPARQPLTMCDRAPRVGWCSGSGTGGDATFLKTVITFCKMLEKSWRHQHFLKML